MFLEVFRGHEALAAGPTFVLCLEHVNLRLHMSVQVTLGHSFVVTQLAVELADSCRKLIYKTVYK